MVPDRNKRGLVEFSDEMGTDNEIATDDICSPAEGAAVESGRRPRQKMGEITKSKYHLCRVVVHPVCA